MQVRPVAKQISERFTADITKYCDIVAEKADSNQQSIVIAQLNSLVGLTDVLKEDSLPMLKILMEINKKLATPEMTANAQDDEDEEDCLGAVELRSTA
jgi:hypothetical protein